MRRSVTKVPGSSVDYPDYVDRWFQIVFDSSNMQSLWQFKRTYKLLQCDSTTTSDGRASTSGLSMAETHVQDKLEFQTSLMGCRESLWSRTRNDLIVDHGITESCDHSLSDAFPSTRDVGWWRSPGCRINNHKQSIVRREEGLGGLSNP